MSPKIVGASKIIIDPSGQNSMLKMMQQQNNIISPKTMSIKAPQFGGDKKILTPSSSN